MDGQRLVRLVAEALAEDLGTGDVTSLAVVPEDARCRGEVVARQALVVSGLDVAAQAFRHLDTQVVWEPASQEGARAPGGAVLARLQGRARAVLGAERVALNFLQRLCGVATHTARFVEAVRGTGTRVRDTRKTTPLMRALEKRAVVSGGGHPHRHGLDGALLVKDNHVRLAGSVAGAVRLALAGASGLPVEVEVDRLDQVDEALAAGATLLLLDNFTPEQAGEAVRQVAGRARLEASGGIRLDNVRAYAEAGVDYVAVGALTHSAPAADVSLDVEPT